MLLADLDAPRKQRHTAKRVFGVPPNELGHPAPYRFTEGGRRSVQVPGDQPAEIAVAEILRQVKRGVQALHEQ